MLKPARPVAVLAALAVTVALGACGPRHPQRPFEPAAWAAADLMASTRAEMAEDLVASGRLLGKSRSEVVALLGAPTPTDKWRDYDLIYVIGPDLIDFEWLLIRLDGRGRVADVHIRSD